MDEAQVDETLKLGGNIVLSGFRELDGSSMIILKKIVGNYAKRISEFSEKFESVSLTMKPLHVTEGSKKFELHAKLIDNGKVFNSEVVDRNLFVAVDSVLKKIQSAITK